METKSIMIVGVGGQGTLLASRILGAALISNGFDVKVSEVHGMSQRGGSVVTYVKYGSKVNSPIVNEGEADLILAFEQLEAARWLQYLKKDGTLIINTQKIDPMSVIIGNSIYPDGVLDAINKAGAKTTNLDALSLAVSAGSAKAVNVVLIGVMADGIGSIVASIFGVLPNTSFSQNVGLVTVTKIVNRFVIMTGAIFLILCGFCPKLSAIFSVMPQSVLGGAAVIMFSMILVSGLQSLSRETLDGRNGLIVALAIGIGVGIGNVPEVLAQCPEWVSNIFAQNGIIMTFVVATVLNLILPRNNEEAKKEQMGA